MPEHPSQHRDQRKVDLDHIKLLAIFHFIGACLGFIGVAFIALHYVMMQVMISDPGFWSQAPQATPPAEFFEIFKWFYALMGFWFLVRIVLNIISGICMLKQKARFFSLIVAGINCIHVPIGTTLGVFTIIVLVRDSVVDIYDRKTETN